MYTYTCIHGTNLLQQSYQQVSLVIKDVYSTGLEEEFLLECKSKKFERRWESTWHTKNSLLSEHLNRLMFMVLHFWFCAQKKSTSFSSGVNTNHSHLLPKTKTARKDEKSQYFIFTHLSFHSKSNLQLAAGNHFSLNICSATRFHHNSIFCLYDSLTSTC